MAHGKVIPSVASIASIASIAVAPRASSMTLVNVGQNDHFLLHIKDGGHKPKLTASWLSWSCIEKDTPKDR